jgi:hypothetical protein
MSSGRGNAFTTTRKRPSTHKSLLVNPKREARSQQQRSPTTFHHLFSCGYATTEPSFLLDYRTSHEVIQKTPMPELRGLAKDLLVFEQSRTQRRLQKLWNATEHR